MIKKTVVIFRGERTPLEEQNKVIFSIDGGQTWANLPLFLDEVNHSPTGFEWGYWGSGPAQLAYAVLRIHCTLARGDPAEDTPRHNYQTFKQDFIGSIRKDFWEIDSRQIEYWLREKGE
jgi:hypothetical protein